MKIQTSLTDRDYKNIFNPHGVWFSPLNMHMGNDGMHVKVTKY